MTVAQDRIVPWQGSTSPTDEKSVNPSGEVLIISEGNGVLNPADYGDDLENIVDIFTRRRYLPGIHALSADNTDTMRTDIKDYVKMSSENRTKMVPLDAVARGASGIVGLLCIASLIFSTISKFQMIHPFVAIVVLAAALFFYITTMFVPKDNK
jgi:hypothetical protein